MKIIESILTKNPCYTAGKKITVKGLMLHSVGCPQPNASAFIKNWNKASFDAACVHAFIDGDSGDVYQTLPWNHRGWHGGGSSNNTHIGVEMCEPDCIKYTGGASFTCSNKAEARKVAARTYKSAVALFAFLCEKYNLNPLADGVIVSHKEGYARGIASNHGDPEHLWKQLDLGYTMDTFRKAVKNAMKADETKSDVLYRVQVGAFSVKSNAINMQSKLKKSGYKDALIVKRGNLYRVQVGAFSKKSNAENYAEELEQKDFSTYITTKSGTAVASKKTIEEVAKEVIQGKWGNGEARVNALVKAGYDHEAVQRKVNELL